MKWIPRKREEYKEEAPKKKTYLEELCESNEHLLRDLQFSLLISPERIAETPEDFASKGKELETQGNLSEALQKYAMAGRKALAELNPKDVERYFKMYRELVSRIQKDNTLFEYIAEHPEEAVEIAKKYYKFRALEEREKGTAQ